MMKSFPRHFIVTVFCIVMIGTIINLMIKNIDPIRHADLLFTMPPVFILTGNGHDQYPCFTRKINYYFWKLLYTCEPSFKILKNDGRIKQHPIVL